MSRAVDYMKHYLPITWKYDNNDYKASVRKYLISLRDTKEHASRITGAETARDRLLAEIKRELGQSSIPPMFRIEKQAFSLGEIQASFRGKASPEMLRKTLWLATHFQFIRQPSPKKPKSHPHPPTDPQTYADWYLGTDCSGFVNNFLGHRYGSMLEIPSYDKDKGDRRLKASLIAPGDVVLSWSPGEPYGHIAIVEKISLEERQFRVRCVESLGMNGVGVTDTNIRLVLTEQVKDDPGGFYSSALKQQGLRYYFHPSPESFSPVP